MHHFVLEVSFSQMAVFDVRLVKPFNDWTNAHVRQGFAWRPHSVSFSTLITAGAAIVECSRSCSVRPMPGCTRAISVPFALPAGRTAEVATITESRALDISPGEYQLVLQTGITGDSCVCRFAFIENGDLTPCILLADEEIDKAAPLLMEAEPA